MLHFGQFLSFLYVEYPHLEQNEVVADLSIVFKFGLTNKKYIKGPKGIGKKAETPKIIPIMGLFFL